MSINQDIERLGFNKHSRKLGSNGLSRRRFFRLLRKWVLSDDPQSRINALLAAKKLGGMQAIYDLVKSGS